VRNHEDLKQELKQTLKDFLLISVDELTCEYENKLGKVAEVLGKLNQLQEPKEDVS
jgi:hypothetical protein